ncbi:MAG: T9SS type A sorting domain-containing protein [Chitinophagales bacterium]
MKRKLPFLFIALLLYYSFSSLQTQLIAQCIDSTTGPGIYNSSTGQWEIACDASGSPFTISATTASSISGAASQIQWSNGAVGSSFNFTPNCDNLGLQSFTPCLPAGVSVPTQFFTLPNLNGNISANNSITETFFIPSLCFQTGAAYNGEIEIYINGGGPVNLIIELPDGTTSETGNLDPSLLELINNSVPVSFIPGLDGNPSGEWKITIENNGGGSMTYQVVQSQLSISAFTTSSLVCSPPVNINVFGGCPAYNGIQTSATDVCSSEDFTLSANIEPSNAPNVTYNWSGPGIDASNQNSSSPMISFANLSCDIEVASYNLTLTCTNDGSVLANGGQNLSVNIYPAINENDIAIDNTTNIQDPDCSIIVSSTACPNFTIDAMPQNNTQVFSSGDNGSTASFVVSNGYCELELNPTINCLSNCNLATAAVTVGDCDGNDNFVITVNLSDLGDASSLNIVPSQGNTQTATATGNFTFGPYSDGEIINLKILDPSDPSCNQNLGFHTQNCLGCPELTGITNVVANQCADSYLNLFANVNNGADGVHYSIQWYKNGIALADGTSASYAHYLNVADRCTPEEQIFTAELTCLTGGVQMGITSRSTSPTMVYTVPEFGRDFVIGQCSVTPTDNCGNLTIDVGGATDLSAGDNPVTVNYAIGIADAPASCQATGSYEITCPDCDNKAGNATSTAVSVCFGESFDISNVSALTTQAGYEIGLAVTPEPPSTYDNMDQLLNATTVLEGPFLPPGTITPETFINNGSNFNFGETYYFTPFVSFTTNPATAGSLSYNDSGTFTAPEYPSLGEPGLGGGVITIPNLPFCSGYTSYDIELCVEDVTTDTQDPISEDFLFGAIELPGGVFSNFPNLNNLHDSCDEFLIFTCDEQCYYQNNWGLSTNEGNPSGESFNIVMVNVIALSDIELDWDINMGIDNGQNINFPFPCDDCPVLGEPIAVTMMKPVQLLNGISPPEICEGESINLLNYKPLVGNLSPDGFFEWYNGDPNSDGQLIADPTQVVPNDGQQFYAYYQPYENNACGETYNISIDVYSLPQLSVPTLAPVCSGESIDFTAVESQITNENGNIKWYMGEPNNGGALLSNASAVVPLGSEQYCALFTNPSTGCSNYVCLSANYNSNPVLLAANPVFCPDETVNLRDIENQLTNDIGTFIWYDADPNLGGNEILADAQNDILVTPNDQSTYFVSFTDNTTTCSAFSAVTYTQNELPVLSLPTISGVCPNTSVDLSLLESQVTSETGTFQWYLGNPQQNGTLIDDATDVVPNGVDSYFVVFTADNTACRNLGGFVYPVNDLPNVSDNLPTPNLLCANAEAINLNGLESQLSSDDVTFVWYNGDPENGGEILDNNNFPDFEDNPAAQIIANGTDVTFYAVLTDNNTNCVNTLSLDYSVFNDLSGANIVYDCDLGLQIDLANVIGGSENGIQIAATSPNQTNDMLAHQAAWTVIIEDDNGCSQTLSGTVDCPVCEAGNANALVNNILCVGDAIQITNTTAQLDEPGDFTIGWAISPLQAVTDENGVNEATANDLIFQSTSGGYNLDFTHDGDLDAGIYYATPFISEQPPQIGPPTPIVYDPDNGCVPVGEICPQLAGEDWAISELIISFPDGSFLNVNDDFLGGIEITPALVSGLPNGQLPCLPLADLYTGDPNGTWSISITNSGVGSLDFSVPDFFVTVDAASCGLITENQESFIAGASGTVVANTTFSINLEIPSPQVVLPSITYNPTNGCTPVAEICPTISGEDGWEILPLIVNFPDGSQINVAEELIGSPDLPINQAALDLAAPGGTLCLVLTDLYTGDPNGTWSIEATNIGTGSVSFDIPEFNVFVSTAGCSELTEDEITTIDAVSGTIAVGTTDAIEILIPPLPSLFPAIDAACEDYGDAVQIVLLDDIAFGEINAECVDKDAQLYSVSVANLSGGAAAVLPNGEYIFPNAASYDAIANTYTFETTIDNFPYNFEITNNENATNGTNCPATATIVDDPCICIPPTVIYATQCIDQNGFEAVVNITAFGNSATYTITDNLGSASQTVSATGLYTFGNYANDTEVMITLVANDDELCNDMSENLTNNCLQCTTGNNIPLASNVFCCDESADIALGGTIIEDNLIIAWAFSENEITDTADLNTAISIEPANEDNSFSFTNDCTLAAGIYYATPLISQAPGAIPQADPITYNPALGCNPFAEICITITGEDGWEIVPLFINFPDGSQVNAVESLGLPGTTPINQGLLGVAAPDGIICLPLTDLYSGDPNGTWSVEATNVGTGSVSFDIADFNVVVNATDCLELEVDEITNINAVSGTIEAGTTNQVDIVIPNPNTEIPDFPTIDANCNDIGESVEIVVVDAISYDFSANCYDSDGNDVYDGIELTISNISGGSPALGIGEYILPDGFELNGNTYTQIVSTDLSETNFNVTISSSINGQNNDCGVSKNITLPFCPSTCINPTVLFGETCIEEGNFFYININVSNLGSGNNSFTVANDFDNSTFSITTTGVSQAGPFPNNANITISVIGDTDNACLVTSNVLTADCSGCSAGTGNTLNNNILCCNDEVVLSTQNADVDAGFTVAWALANDAVTSENDLNNAIGVWPADENGNYAYTNDCDLAAGTYYFTPFVAQTPGEVPQPDPVTFNPASNCLPDAQLCPQISGTDWEIQPLLITFPDGNVINVAEALVGFDVAITPALIETLGGLPCLGIIETLGEFFNGNPNGEWIIEVNNIGTGDVLFELDAFDVIVPAADCALISEDEITIVPPVSGTIAGGTSDVVIIQIPAPNDEQPAGFPTIDADCEDYGQAVEIVVVDDINFDFAIACYDADGNSIDDGFEMTISSISGGSPALGIGNYILPDGFSETFNGVYTSILPEGSVGTQTVSVSSSEAGQNDLCEATKTATIPTDCFFGCTSPTALFGTNCPDENTSDFYVSVNITEFGEGNSSYTISNNLNNSTENASSIGVVSVGPFAANSNVTITIAGNDDSACVIQSESLTDNCPFCEAGTATTNDDNVLCCGDSATFSTSNSNINVDGNVIAWALAENTITQASDLDNALGVWPSDENGNYTFTNDCNLEAGVYEMTPFISQTPGEIPPTEPIIFDPANNCIPNATLCPQIEGTGWIIDPFLMTFPDGTTINVVEALGFPPVPIDENLLALIGGIPCLDITTLAEFYNGNPNGDWVLSVNNTGTGSVGFSVPSFDVVVSASECSNIITDQVVTIEAVSGTIAAGTSNEIVITMPPANTQPADFPNISSSCESYGEPAEIVIVDDIDFDISAACNDVNNDGIDDEILVTVSNISGGVPAILNADYVLPNNFNTSDNGQTYTASLSVDLQGSDFSLSINSDANSDCDSEKTITLPIDCETDACNPVVSFETVAVNETAFEINVIVDDLGAGSSSFTISNNFNGETLIFTNIGTYTIGDFDCETEIIVTVSSDEEADCEVVSNILTVFCAETCYITTANVGVQNVLCCDESLDMSVSDFFLQEEMIIGWAVADSPITDENGLDNAISLNISDENNAYQYTNACDLPAGTYYCTPFAAKTTDEIPVTEPILYNPEEGCVPNGELCPVITGEDWIIQPLLINFPDGSQMNVAENLLGTDLPITPAFAGLIPCLELISLYEGDPNGEWSIEVNNIGTGAVNFEISSFDITVAAADCSLTNSDIVVSIPAVTGTIEGGTSDIVTLTIPPLDENAQPSDFPSINADCEAYGQAIEMLIVDDISFDLSATCVDNNDDGNDDEYLVTIENIGGGSPAVIASSNYVLPNGFVETENGIYTLVLDLENSGNFEATISDDLSTCILTQNTILAECQTISGQAPVIQSPIIFEAESNETISFNLLDYVTDADSETVILVSVEQPAVGEIVIGENGEVTFNAPANFDETITVSFTVTDGNFEVTGTFDITNCANRIEIELNYTTDVPNNTYTIYAAVTGGNGVNYTATSMIAINGEVEEETYTLNADTITTLGPFFAPDYDFVYQLLVDDGENCQSVADIAVIIDLVSIELLHFGGQILDEGNLIQWTTAAEKDNAYFTLYHSKDGQTFVPIESQKGGGTTTTTQRYDFLHEAATEGKNYYRLDQTDFDGTTTSSTIINLVRTERNDVSIQIVPVPASDFINIYSSSSFVASEKVELNVYDLTGRLVEQKMVLPNDNSITLDIENYAAGVYIISLNDGNTVATEKFVKK